VRPSPVIANSPSLHVATSIVGSATDHLPLLVVAGPNSGFCRRVMIAKVTGSRSFKFAGDFSLDGDNKDRSGSSAEKLDTTVETRQSLL
jgi:hypothetical protein